MNGKSIALQALPKMKEGWRDINRQGAKSAKSAKVFMGHDDALDAALKYCDVERR